VSGYRVVSKLPALLESIIIVAAYFKFKYR